MEQVKYYKYIGSIVNGDNSIEEEIKEIIALGSKVYYANQKIFKSKLLLKKAKKKVVLVYNKICDNICPRNVGTKRICEKKITDN